jgi:hypothetical protein
MSSSALDYDEMPILDGIRAPRHLRDEKGRIASFSLNQMGDAGRHRGVNIHRIANEEDPIPITFVPVISSEASCQGAS